MDFLTEPQWFHDVDAFGAQLPFDTSTHLDPYATFQMIPAAERKMPSNSAQRGGRATSARRRRGRQSGASARFKQPRADVYETDEEFIVRLELPGFKKQDIVAEIVDQNILKVETKSPHFDEYDESKVIQPHYLECHRTPLRRRVHIPPRVDQDSINATFTDGILKFVFKFKGVYKAPPIIPVSAPSPKEWTQERPQEWTQELQPQLRPPLPAMEQVRAGMIGPEQLGLSTLSVAATPPLMAGPLAVDLNYSVAKSRPIELVHRPIIFMKGIFLNTETMKSNLVMGPPANYAQPLFQAAAAQPTRAAEAPSFWTFAADVLLGKSVEI